MDGFREWLGGLRGTEQLPNENRKVQDYAIAIDESNGLRRSKNERGSVLDAVRAAEASIDVMLLRVRRALMG
ncbi:MAG: hypothetical protein BMS9Abin37_0775 [Acidobacteriota bacterium]|nr:MAG: hypothetical protein BMS9Abin37_0775 [Acidobacteriota bacterium]